jgi:hypothetical protein
MATKPISEQDVIEKEVCILGAGGAGCYTAIQLQDRNISTIVLEKSSRIGGHSETYRERGDRNFCDIGVRLYPDVPIVRQYYDRMGVRLTSVDLTKGRRIYVDVKTGERAPVKEPNPLLIWFALWRYERIIKKNFSFLEKPGIQLPATVPEDLTLPFEAFLHKYKLGRSYKPITHYLQGQGAVKNLPALYALKNISPAVTKCARTNSFVAAASGVDTLYEKIQVKMGEALRCNVQVQSIRRNVEVIEITATQDRSPLNIRCRKLYVTFPPTLTNMESFDLDQQEKSVFEKFKSFYYWTVMVKISGLPTDTVFFPIDGTDPLTGQVIPGIYTIVPTSMPETYNILYGSEQPLTEQEVLDDITGFVQRMSNNLTGQEIKLDSVDLFRLHTPFGTHVTPDEICNSFYQSLLALQGHRNTYYLGAAVDTNESRSVWIHAADIVQTLFGQST